MKDGILTGSKCREWAALVSVAGGLTVCVTLQSSAGLLPETLQRRREDQELHLGSDLAHQGGTRPDAAQPLRSVAHHHHHHHSSSHLSQLAELQYSGGFLSSCNDFLCKATTSLVCFCSSSSPLSLHASAPPPLSPPPPPGLSAPVSRGRKGHKIQNHLSVSEAKDADWLVHCNPEVVLQDDSYKKHLKQHCNKCVHSQSMSHWHVRVRHPEMMVATLACCGQCLCPPCCGLRWFFCATMIGDLR